MYQDLRKQISDIYQTAAEVFVFAVDVLGIISRNISNLHDALEVTNIIRIANVSFLFV